MLSLCILLFWLCEFTLSVVLLLLRVSLLIVASSLVNPMNSDVECTSPPNPQRPLLSSPVSEKHSTCLKSDVPVVVRLFTGMQPSVDQCGG